MPRPTGCCSAGAGSWPGIPCGAGAGRSVNLIVAILAVLLKTGRTPALDPEYPQARLEFMLRDSGARLLLTTGDVQAKIGLNLTAVEEACATLLLDAAETVSAIAAMPTAQH